LKQVEAQTGYSKTYFFVAGVAIVTGILTAVGGAKLIVDLLGFVYPAYMSFKAMDTSDSGDDTQWLTYWVVFSFLSILESMLGFIIFLIPFYFWIKIVLIGTLLSMIAINLYTFMWCLCVCVCDPKYLTLPTRIDLHCIIIYDSLDVPSYHQRG
jgi:hypothetical protein